MAMPALRVVEEFFNKNHSTTDGKFTAGSRTATGKQAYRPGKDFIHHEGGSYKISGSDVWRDAGAGLKNVTGTPEGKGALKAHNAELARQSRQVVMDDLNKVSAKRAAARKAHLRDPAFEDNDWASARVLEFYNKSHDPATGRFSGRAASGRAGFREGSPGVGRIGTGIVGRKTKGFVQHKDALKEAQAKAAAANTKMAADNANRAKYGGLKSGGSVGKQGVMVMTKQAAHRAEAARQIDLRNERIKAAAGNSQTKVPQGPQHGNRGGPVVSAKLPLRNATTGRINPLPVRHAFKQGLAEIIGKKQDSKRTTLTGPKVNTVKTYKGRVISHVSSKGGPTKSEKIGKVPASSHIDYDRVIKNLNAHTQGAVNFFRGT